MFAIQEFGPNQQMVQARQNVSKKMSGLTVDNHKKVPDHLVHVLLELPIKPTIVYWLCAALNAQCKGLVIHSDQSKRLVPYLVRRITSAEFSGIEDLTAMTSLLGNLMVRFPG